MGFFAHLGRDIQNIILSYLDQTDLVHLLRINKDWHQSPILNSKIQLLKEWSEEKADYFRLEKNQINACLISKNGELINCYPPDISIETCLITINLSGEKGNFFWFVSEKDTFCFEFKQETVDDIYNPKVNYLELQWDFKKNISYWYLEKQNLDYYPLIHFDRQLFSSFKFKTIRHIHVIEAKFQHRFFEPRFGMFLTYYFKTFHRIPQSEQNHLDEVEQLIQRNSGFSWLVESIKNPFSITLE